MNKKNELGRVAQEVEKCQKCPLYKKATQAVPGAGNPEAEVMFIGEGPGYHEDQQGLPFVGAAGKLLDKALSSIKLKREGVFIGNIVKHRPPGNRDPLPAEIKACTPFLARQIKIINPKIIATLGRFAMNYFLPDVKISQVHGQARYITWQEKRFVLLPLYHPAAALRRGTVMEDFLKDFKKITMVLDKIKNKSVEKLEEIKEERDEKEQLRLI